jgi:CheY-like chemotaxis protein
LQVNDIEVIREFDPDLPRTMLDFHQVQQVLLNLINNAQHAMTGQRDKPGRLVVRTRVVNDVIEVQVSDNGDGMSQDTLERVFDPFFTTKEPGRGTGLGLSVSYGIVKEHGGRIYARTRSGQGSTFVIEFPVRGESVDPEQAVDEAAPSTLAHAGGGSRLLVVDDEPMILDLIVDLFHDQEVHVDTASNGSEACRKIEQKAYDVVLTDVRMPQMNGLELYSQILGMRPEMQGRVIFMTGDLIDEEISGFISKVEAVTIPKPLEIPVVLSAVAETLERR